jgi:sialate O-acetylesterase
MRKIVYVLLLPIFFLASISPVCATVTLPSFFTNYMVLQQQSNVPMWGWARPGAGITITTSWNGKKYSIVASSAGEWKTRIATPAAGGPFQVTVSDGTPVVLSNVLIGEVWLCSGQSNMEMPMKGFRDQPVLHSNDAVVRSANNNIRLYTVPRSVKTVAQKNSKPSEWKMAGPESVANFSATGYYFGRLLYDMLHVPIGLVNISYGGSTAEAWMDSLALKDFGDIKIAARADSAKVNNRSATTLFNGMLHPFVGYGIKGCIWYQGESNYERPDQYEKLFPAMVQQWRNEWGQVDFPFYYAQIAPYNYAQLPPYNSGGKFNSAYLRDAQRKALATISNSGMAVLMDIGEENSIHPAHKEEGGTRLAYLALAKTYGLKGFGNSSPAFDSLIVNGNVATIKFTDAPNGLTSFGKPLVNFEIAGADKYFRPAKAVIARGAILVSSPDVKEPVAVRYAFRDFVTAELFSTEGLPVSSFRTDNW